MVIYRDLKHTALTENYLNRVRHLISELWKSGLRNHSLSAELLIEFSELETSLTDFYSAGGETFSLLIRNLRSAGKELGKVFCNTWNRNNDSYAIINKFNEYFSEISLHKLPETISVKIPEGYAFYGYYPETYLDAAKKFFTKEKPEKTVVIGLRSIGTSFSSVVSAYLELEGCEVFSITVRPRGEYENRHLLLTGEFIKEIHLRKDHYFLIVDEGPGLSGSSFGSVAEKLSTLGIEDNKIIFLSSWRPDGKGLISEVGSRRWQKHKSFSSDFDDTWIKSGRLGECLPYKELLDISNGNWRTLFYNNNSDFPGTYPVEERKKYLCSRHPIRLNGSFPGNLSNTIPREDNHVLLVKFAGLGGYGKTLYKRALALASSSYAPKVLGFENGFLILEFIKGKPVTSLSATDNLLSRAAGYLSYLKEKFPVSPGRSFEEIYDMIYENTGEYIGEDIAQLVEKYKGSFESKYSNTAMAVDGHMFPHEWVMSGSMYYKTDGINHHADQFFPGCQDITWDVAGFVVEFGLNEDKTRKLLNQFESSELRKSIIKRLPFYKISYLAYRMGYCAVVSDILSSSPEGKKFKVSADSYASQIKNELFLYTK